MKFLAVMLLVSVGLWANEQETIDAINSANLNDHEELMAVVRAVLYMGIRASDNIQNETIREFWWRAREWERSERRAWINGVSANYTIRDLSLFLDLPVPPPTILSLSDIPLGDSMNPSASPASPASPNASLVSRPAMHRGTTGSFLEGWVFHLDKAVR